MDGWLSASCGEKTLRWWEFLNRRGEAGLAGERRLRFLTKAPFRVILINYEKNSLKEQEMRKQLEICKKSFEDYSKFRVFCTDTLWRMDLGQDFDRMLFCEHARKNAEAAYAKNPLDAENLTNWAGALIELSQFQSRSDSIKFVKDAISKLEEALGINPRKHDALCALGNAHNSLAFYFDDLEDAKPHFAKAMQCFQQALEEDPDNQIYIKSIELTAKAPELHVELHTQMAKQQAAGGGPSSSGVKMSKKKNNGDLKYDILGWVILAVGIVVWVGMAKSNVPPAPPR
ncbi:hypothetical protein HPP92_008075 [Vanilla planifolia]|uniref:Mitochondrial import receptor subunit TOM20 n=2 Tax=Vanilla planifolia TaxID=51239 RepID=A0A835V6H5_VANPL|nr:hypothetical protein HPP92_008075 [Vanilla planifolia]